MEKGFTWLFNGYLKPECGTCHHKDNRYKVTEFAQEDAAASFAVLKTVTSSAKLLEAVLGNVFCKGCVITKDDPLYVDLQYFTQHMDSCEKP
jgi:K+/H+ antiporter YhaU regulatory subunit KhtT